MFIHATLYLISSISIPIIICMLLSIWIKRKFNNYYGVLIGLILSGILFGLLQVAIPKVYIIKDNHQVKKYRLIGSKPFQFDNGLDITLRTDDPMKVIVVNNSSENLVVQELVYSDPGFYRNDPDWKKIIAKIDSNYSKAMEPKVFPIANYSVNSFRLAHGKIDYFFDQTIPHKIKEYGTTDKKKYWLRIAY